MTWHYKGRERIVWSISFIVPWDKINTAYYGKENDYEDR